MSAADELRALTAAATPGPWDINPEQSHYLAPQVRFGGGMGGLSAHGLHDEADAALIVWCRNHAAALADLIDAANVMADRHADEDALVESPLLALRAALAALEADR